MIQEKKSKKKKVKKKGLDCLFSERISGKS